ncbi:hypothetical protein Tco_0253038, partial [Tanacetum coccineum]
KLVLLENFNEDYSKYLRLPVEVTAIKVRVTAAKHKLVLLVILMKNMLSITTTDRVTTAERFQLLEEFMLTEKRSKTYQRNDKDFLKIKNTYKIKALNKKKLYYTQDLLLQEAMDSQSTQTIKLPILQPIEYDPSKIRMEQYLKCIDYTLWEIVENTNTSIVIKTVDGKETVIPHASVEEKA